MTYEHVAGFNIPKSGGWPLPSPHNPVPPLATAVERILQEVRNALQHDLGAAKAGAARLAALLDSKTAEPAPAQYVRGGFAPWQKRRVKEYLSEHLDSPILIEGLAEIISLSTSHFCRAFKESFGETPHAYLMRLRVERAQELMLTTREPLSQIALSCGLADQAHLSKLFRRRVGQSPSTWRRIHAVGT